MTSSSCALVRCAALRAGLAALAFGAPFDAPAAAAEARLPDVVVFVIDTLRADRVGIYGYSRPTTPRIDALATESVIFDQASSAAPWTLPSVVSMMTSTFPCEHGVRVDGERLREEIVPLAEHLRRAGYATYSFIANGYAGKSSGLDRGFEHPAVLPSIGGETVRRWLDVPADRPLFLYVHDIRPHDPYQASVETIGLAEPVALELRQSTNRSLQRYRKLTKVDFDAGRPQGDTDNARAQRRVMSVLAKRQELIQDLYAAEVRAADEIVGEIIAELKRLGRWENTLFVLTSDHGEEFAEHDGWQHDQSLYEELIRVPLIVRLPGGEGAGRRMTAPVSLVDLVPTVADLLDLPEMTQQTRGRSWLPDVRASAEASTETPNVGGKPRIVAERHDQKKFFAPFVALRGHRNVAIRDGSWKAIWNIEPDTLELYDLATDPAEARDRSADSPARANAMKQAAREWLAACPAPKEPVPTGPLDPSDEQQLRALGYID